MLRIITLATGMSLLTSIAFADQSVYIDQVSGDNLTLTITQRNGAGNSIGDPSNVAPYFVLSGNSQTLDITQDGAGNSLVGNIQGSSLRYDLTITGDSNIFDYSINNADNSDYLLNVVGSGNTIDWASGAEVSSTYADIDYDLIGDYNAFTVSLESDGAKQQLTYSGDYNTIDITQKGYGTSLEGHSIIHNLIGSSNSITILQETTLEASVINLDTNGSYQSISIVQSD